MEGKRITDYIGETTECEKKSRLEVRKPKSWMPSVSAFANTRGGMIIFGIGDNDELLGLPDAKGDSEVISELLNYKLDPVPDIDLKIIREAGLDFILLKVSSGISTPYYYIGEGTHVAYVRLGNESVPASTMDLNNLVLKGSHLSFDCLKSTVPLNAGAFSRLRSLHYQRTSHILNDSDFISFGLATDDGFLTNAGVLFSDENRMIQSRIFCTRWKGLNKAAGLAEAAGDREAEGSILWLLEEAMCFVKIHNEKGWMKRAECRINFPDYPEEAVRECIVNALVHRDYRIVGSEVHIDIFDDRMEIYSPGGMVDGSKIQDRDVETLPSRRRNPIIADIFSRLNLAERRGSGFKKINEQYRNAVSFRPEKRPGFYSDQYSFIATLYNLNYAQPFDTVIVKESDYHYGPIFDNFKKALFEKLFIYHKLDTQSLRLVEKLYSQYGKEGSFSRSAVSDISALTLSEAGRFISHLKEAGVIAPATDGRGRYRFSL